MTDKIEIPTADQYVEFICHRIWGEVVTTTRAFKNVTIKVDSNNQRVFISISLAWWATVSRLKKLRSFWLRKAEKRALKEVPDGWKLLIYYGGDNG